MQTINIGSLTVDTSDVERKLALAKELVETLERAHELLASLGSPAQYTINVSSPLDTRDDVADLMNREGGFGINKKRGS
jgi:hypothetical protein